MIHDPDPDRDTLLSWILHDSDHPIQLARAWEHLLLVPIRPVQDLGDLPRLPRFRLSRDIPTTLSDDARAKIAATLEANGHNLKAAAQTLGINRSTLYYHGFKGVYHGRPRKLRLANGEDHQRSM